MYGVPRDFNATYFIGHLEQSLEMMCQQAVKRCQVLNAEMQGYTNRWSERMRRRELLFFQQQLHLRREMIDEAMLQSLRPSSAQRQQFWREVVQILFQICITVEPRVSVIKRNHYFFDSSQRKSLVEAACVESASVTLRNQA